MAAEIAKQISSDTGKLVGIEPHPADWNKHGRSAGPIRNQEMLDSGLNFCFAFVDKPLAESKGTADMVRRCRAAGVQTIVFEVLA